MSSTPEPEWSEQDQAWMLALADYRATRCPNCGRDIRECTAPDAEYEVPPAVRCHATTALAIARQAFTNPQPQAMLWRVERR